MQCAIVALWMLFNIQCCFCAHRQAAGACFSSSVLPIHLRELRTAYQKISHYFQSRDHNIQESLLKGRLKHGMKSRESCQFLKEMLSFYLRDVIPAAKTHNRGYNNHISKIANTLYELQVSVEKCHQLFNCDTCNCQRSQHIERIYKAYQTFQDTGIYKAMGELNLFIDWLDQFLSTKLRSANRKKK